ncbi:DUF6443 domain-containing protein [Chryseolinea sp. H1M3-3]|uniref:DUF6443 domain-containing protein n=1 Tax=Chryseolinea sp. H1M3-3 TaxID=3034144 RepID=UPI0023EC95E9|nr:DUF6443 domain-containing protein [Chryseolinea sp. H1M3-3]
MRTVLKISLYFLFCTCIVTYSFGQVSTRAVPPGGGGGTPPANPPNPTASTNACGAKTLTRSGTPPSGTAWYWQTTANGTSLDYSTATYQAQTSGTYYIRAHTPSTDLWSTGAGYITVTVNPSPAAPAGPSIQHNCYNAVFTRGTPPSGVTWYWQDTNAAGTSTSNSADIYTANTSGTYYIRSYNSAGCWGGSTAIAFTQSASPAIPPTPLSSGVCGSATISFNGTPPQFIRWAWQTNSNGTDLTNLTTNHTVTNSGTYYLRAYDLNSQCWSAGASQISVTVTPLPETPPIPTASPGCGQSTLTHPNAAPSDVTWYWQDVHPGSSTSSSEVTYNVTTGGTYYLRARTNTNGCWSTNSSSADVYVKLKPGPPSGTNVIRNDAGLVTLNAIVGTNGHEVRWYAQGGGLLASGDSYKAIIGATATYELASFNRVSSCESDRTIVTATVVPKPVISATDVYFIMNKAITLSLPNNTYTTYSWKKDGVQVGTGATVTLTNAPGTYTVTVTKTGMTGSGTSEPLILRAAGNNSVTSRAIIKEGVTDAGLINSLTASERTREITYSGGFGNIIQTNIGNVSPLQKDIIVPIEYDALGRQLKSYLPYVSAAGDGQLRTLALNNNGYTNSEQYKFYQNATKIERDTKPYTLKEIEPSPLGRSLSSLGVGNDWHANQKKNTRQYLFNRTADGIRVWTVAASGLPTSSNTYGDYELAINISIDENGNRVKVYSDKIGRSILKEIEVDATTWLRTYSIYDDFGRLVYTISPEGVKAANFSPTQAFLDQWAFQYRYDNLGRTIEYKAPASGWVYTVYDVLSRPVMTQNADQRTRSEWSFVKYDVYSRPAVSGVKVIASSTRSSVQGSVDTQANVFELTTNNAVGYTLNRTYPTVVEADLLSINYYDNYAFLSYAGWNVETLSFNFVPEQGITAYETKVTGLPTGGKIKVLGSSVWLNAVQYYDKYYRPLQIIAENHLTGVDRNTNKFNNLRQLVETRFAHHNQSVIVLQKYHYDHAGRLTKIYHNINGAAADQLVAQYEYNELGQLVDKKLHNTTGTTFIQSVDFRYNIRGWMLSINNSQLNINASNNDETNDFFGMEIVYTKPESGLTDTLYHNGNIRAVKWKGIGSIAGTPDQKSYKYAYDKGDRLLTAASQMHTGTAWLKETNTLNEKVIYDHNGNIRSLRRNHRKHQLANLVASYSAETVDNLSYQYSATQGNQLLKVEDAIATSVGSGDFKNISTAAIEYTYNADGNLLADQNKGISSITYNALGKPAVISFSDGKKIEYTYDGAGNKLKVRSYEGTTLKLTTDYLGSFVYENGVLKFFSSPEGRVIKNGTGFEYQYALADYQGNTRVVFSSTTPAAYAPKATFEGDTNDQASHYKYNAANVVSFVGAATSGTKVIRMNQSSKIGPSKSLKVYPGDKIDLEVFEYHEGVSGFGTSSTPITTLVTMVSGAFGGVSGAPGEPGLIYSGVNAAISAYMPPGNQGSTQPAAYLNYILFDANYKVLDMGWKLCPATTFTKQKLVFNTLSIKEPGTIFIYLSYDNDSNNWVYFDDLKVTHTKSNVVQYNEYYPFGHQTSASWTRENSSNNFLYNGASEFNKNSAWYDTFFRNYDPLLGRFHQIDPLANAMSSITPYNYAANDPVFYNDPNGDYVEPTMAPVRHAPDGVGALIAGGADGFQNLVNSMYGGSPIPSNNGGGYSPGSFINGALNSKFGGIWTRAGASLFNNQEEAFVFGSAYNTYHNSWLHTEYKSLSATIDEFGYELYRSYGIAGKKFAINITYGNLEQKMLADGHEAALKAYIASFEVNPWGIVHGTLDGIGLVPGIGEFADAFNAYLYYRRGDKLNAGLSAAAMVPFAGWGATSIKLTSKIIQKSSKFDGLLKEAAAAYPNKAGKVEFHHIEPKYLGGPKNGSLIPINASYHQQITNAFREAWSYGSRHPNAAELNRIMKDVYNQFPLYVPF